MMNMGINNSIYGGYASYGQYSTKPVGQTEPSAESLDPDKQIKVGRRSSPEDCQTCKERKYQDGSDEMVSFKSAAHISPAASASRVRAHEQEHVSNAYSKAAQNGGEVVSCNVNLKTAICPECGRSYVAGGTTSTQIKYSNEKNPYQKMRKAADRGSLVGMNFDAAI